ncbi:MAG: hypothetical protein Q8P41_27730 [Pseudomonadota bacterium]|nr:hypothetical protein [Pseudomonadota bacterium]
MFPTAWAPRALCVGLIAGCDPHFITHFDVEVTAAGVPVEGVTLVAFPAEPLGGQGDSSRAQTGASGRAQFEGGQFLGDPATVLVASHPGYGLWVGGAGAQFPFEPRFGLLGGPTEWDATVHVQFQPPRADVGSPVTCEGRRCVWTISSPQGGDLFLVDPVAGTAVDLHSRGQAVGTGAVRFAVEIPVPGRFHLVADVEPLYAVDGTRTKAAGVHVVHVSDPFDVAD